MKTNKALFLIGLTAIFSLAACERVTSSTSQSFNSSSNISSSNESSSVSSSTSNTVHQGRVPLKELRPFINDLTVSGIKRVLSTDHVGSTAPNLMHFNTYYSSEAQEDFTKVINYLNRVEVVFDNPEPRYGIGSKSLTVTLNRAVPGAWDTYESYSVNALDNCIVVDGVFASLSEPLPTFSHFYGYSFSNQSLFLLKAYENEQDVTSSFPYLSNLNYMLFEPLRDGTTSNGTNEFNKYTFSNPQGTIVFQSETDFVITTEHDGSARFSIINGYTFRSLFAASNQP